MLWNRLQELLLDFINREEGERVSLILDSDLLRKFKIILEALGQEVSVEGNTITYVKRTKS
jgi:hypothetical protein